MTELDELNRLIDSPRTDAVDKIIFRNMDDVSESAIEYRSKFIGVLGRRAELRGGCGSDYCEIGGDHGLR